MAEAKGVMSEEHKLEVELEALVKAEANALNCGSLGGTGRGLDATS